MRLIGFLSLLAFLASAMPLEGEEKHMLPDPLVFSDGKRVETNEDWQRRRGEIRQMLLYHQYGTLPPAPKSWKSEVTAEKTTLDGEALDWRVTLTFSEGAAAFTMRLGLLIPNRPGKFPVVIKNDVAIGHIPMSDRLIDEGYVIAEYLRTDLDPDEAGVIGPAQQMYPDYDWGTLAVWAWGGMRVVDYLLTLPQIDAQKIAVFGHSRGGKVALLTGALDERVAVTLPNGSGAGGAGLYRNQGPKAESLAVITAPERFGYWFSPRLREFAGKEDRLPFDQHFLRALTAPRAVFSTDANGDHWANPSGTREARDAAAPVFAFLRAPEMANGCHFRDGKHDETVADWNAALQFMNQWFGKEAESGWIGYTELRTNLPGGRHVNVRTSRAMVVRTDGTGQRELGIELAKESDTWTQFAGWSPDGSTAIIGCGWQDPENAKWEEEHKRFRMDPGRWRYDGWLMDWRSGKLTDVTGVERVSHYNGVSFTPDGAKLLMTSLVDGTSKPFVMDLDGSNKNDVSGGTDGFTYGFNASPDGKRICYHENYQVYIANADGSAKKHVDTGNAFNFAPDWSPDGTFLVFVSGEHYDCHPHVVRADGTGLRKVAGRGGYRGVTEFLDVPDFHAGSSDTPVWSADGKAIFYTGRVADNVELFRVTLDGETEQLTHSPKRTTHYHPKPSPDGRWLAYGSRRSGIRQLYVMKLEDRTEHPVSDLEYGHAAMWPHWKPVAPAVPLGK